MKKAQSKVSLSGIMDVFTAGIAAATLFGFLGNLHWVFDLFAHFRVQYFQLCLVLIAIALWKRMNKRALIILALIAVNYSLVLPLYFGKPEPATGKPARAMLMNILSSNGNSAEVLKAVESADPDLLLLLEVTPQWEDKLTPLNENYPYRIADPRTDNFGIMMLSKIPLEHGKVLQIGPAGVPSITAEAHFPQGVVSVIGTHPVPPIGKEHSDSRNAQLAELAEQVSGQKYPVLLMGDLNTTSWSAQFKKLLKESGLKNSMKGFGFQPTWRGNAFLKIPLDHVLHAPEITVHNRVIGGNVGSDHLPVIVDFSIR